MEGATHASPGRDAVSRMENVGATPCVARKSLRFRSVCFSTANSLDTKEEVSQLAADTVSALHGSVSSVPFGNSAAGSVIVNDVPFRTSLST
jgi:hypothetical protein